MRRFPLGSYPAMGISQARDEARALHARVKQEGADPIEERRRARAREADARLGVGTLGAVLDLYGTKAGSVLKSWRDSRKRVDLVFKALLTRPAADVRASDLQLAADTYPFPKSASFAVRVIRPALKWGSGPGRQYVSPDLALISPPLPVKARTRVLDRDELAVLLPHLRSSTTPHAAALRFMLLTLVRRGEVETAKWGDVNLIERTWTIPETKNGQPHVVPLSRQAAELLRERMPADPKPDLLVFPARSGAPLSNWDGVTKAIHAKTGTGNWHRHDLRRTGATMLGEMGELPDIVEAALNHVSIRSPLAATYNRSRYRPQVAAALQRLANALDSIEADAAQTAPPGSTPSVVASERA
jgi:integrase